MVYSTAKYLKSKHLEIAKKLLRNSRIGLYKDIIIVELKRKFNRRGHILPDTSIQKLQFQRIYHNYISLFVYRRIYEKKPGNSGILYSYPQNKKIKIRDCVCFKGLPENIKIM